MCGGIGITRKPTAEEKCFNEHRLWFFEVVRGCSNDCPHPCIAQRLEKKEIDPKLLADFFDLTEYDPLFRGSGRIVLYGCGDVSEYKYPKRLHIPNLWNAEITVTKNYKDSPALKVNYSPNTIGVDLYAKVASIDDAQAILKAKRRIYNGGDSYLDARYKGVVVTAQENTEWLEIVKAWMQYADKEEFRTISLKIQSLDQSSLENKTNYLSSQDVVDGLKTVTDKCLKSYISCSPTEKQEDCEYKLTPVIQDILRAKKAPGWDCNSYLDYDVRLCFSQQAPVHKVRIIFKGSVGDGNKEGQYKKLASFLNQKPKCSKWCAFGERWRISGSGISWGEPILHKELRQINKDIQAVIFNKPFNHEETIKNFKDSITCRLCRRCDPIVEKYEAYRANLLGRFDEKIERVVGEMEGTL